ncbi:hypothetical protein [Dactylosporangium matsuzakiense]|uniref:hypothetical protein n=1 Tax=Dactylosporangium matsuzakiense TaxID=53360 RepID=UPI0021C2D44C|nr:hypothetical protein [Dactylosporangium matsuzakiense]UWZ47348.1 hypothetical protein Dmats_13645 [Dactylosporangium matsuzakiense]
MNTEALLDAGAVLPIGTDAAKDTIDTLTTRAYVHPVLGERRVVRLVPATLGQAEDLTMEFLGFTAPQTVAEVGVVRQQALGFPAWALVHDPANGHHALALVKDIERLVRVAKSRIGPARDGFNELGERLARAVPHFLPTYYEEAARAFLAADSQTYAASMFGKAREAERTYALEIDEERQHTVFLEFALAGALTAKALAQHARDLAGRCTPDVAYARFRRLCLERTLGGMPPYAQMHVDLGRLAKAAKLGPEEDESVLRELLAAPSLLRAPGGFWKAYRPALLRIAKREAKVRGQLLGMFPQDCPFGTWLEILEEAGAIEALTAPAGTVDPAAESPDGPAGWLVRADRSRGWRKQRDARFLTLAERMAPRLTADGTPLELAPSHGRIDLDLFDLMLDLGVPLAEVHEQGRCDVTSWLNEDGDGRRDLTHAVTHERLRSLLADSVEGHLRTWYRSGDAVVDQERVAQVVAVPGLRTALHWWLDRLADRVEAQGLTSVGTELDRLNLVACPEGLAVNPEAIARITAFDLGPVLGRTLRAGVIDELGWPALEAATETLFGRDRSKLSDALVVTPQWPALVLRRDDRVLVVGDEGVELDHTLRVPPDELRYSWNLTTRYADGQLLVAWNRSGSRAGYWSGAPDDVFVNAEDGLGDGGNHSLALPDGGRTAGGRPLRAGDQKAQERGRVASDGRHHWLLVQEADYSLRWYEYDAATGERGRASMPSFFEDGAADGQSLEPSGCALRPASPRMAGSPLGHRDGLVGWRSRRTPSDPAGRGSQAGEGVDGRAFAMPDPESSRSHRHRSLSGAIRFPGADTVHGLYVEHNWRSVTVHLYTADGLNFASADSGGDNGPFAEGTMVLPPASFWHQLRPRDEAGSAALRALGDDAAARLLAAVAALAGPDADRAAIPDEAVLAAVRPALPEITDPALLTGVGGVVRHAARAALRLARLTSVTAEMLAAGPAAADATGEDAHRAGDNVVNDALDGLIPSCYNHGREWVKHFTDAAAVLIGGEPRAPLDTWISGGDLDWWDTLGVLPAVLLRVASPATKPDFRAALLDVLEVLAGSGLLDGAGRTRRVTLKSDTGAPQLTAAQPVVAGPGRIVLPFRVDNDGDAYAIEHAADGRFGPVAGHTVQFEREFDRRGLDSAAVARFAAAGRAHDGAGALLRPEVVRALSDAGGISLAEATVLLCATTDARHATIGAFADWEPAGPAVTDAAIEAAVESARRGGGLHPKGGAPAALLPADPAALWTDGPDPARFGAWRAGQVGARTPVSDELIVEYRKAAAPGEVSASEFLHGLTNPATCKWLHAVDQGVDGEALLVTIARGVPWLVRRLPADDPIRAGLPDVLDAVRALIADPRFSLTVAGAEETAVDKALAALGLDRESGLFSVSAQGYWRQVSVHPARMDGPGDRRVDALIAALGGYTAPVVALRAIVGDDITRWLEAPTVEAPHDPSRSAPQIVAQVAERHGIGADAATLYLQLLALPDPTDRNVAAWTGWKPARLKKARAELQATDLVVEAKRPRAGRTLFLPGGWLAWKAPALPVERWKLPLILGGGEHGTALGAVVPIAPAPALFGLAWDRIVAGDTPRFEELQTRATQGGRR